MKLRYYQRDAIESLYTYFERNDGNPLIVMATGTGKSVVIAKFIEEAMTAWPSTRIINATHSRDLVSQNYAEFVNECPFADAGVYSAGLNRRDTHNAVLFAGIQSIYDKADQIGACDLLIIDEAQGVSEDDDTMWRKFISDMKLKNPYLKVIGLTATDYRMNSGLLTTGENAIFTDVVYEYGILRAIEDGYLCPIVPKTMGTAYDIESLPNRRGDYTESQLNAVFNIDEKTRAALDEVESYGADRKMWLIFAASTSHADAIHKELQARGYSGACVTDKTPPKERDKALSDAKSGKIRYLVNRYIFTVGSNIKSIDLIADFGRTLSAGLHVQKLGRGTRCIGADIHESIANGKINCLLLDFARNVDYHGPLDQIRGKDKTKGSGDAPVKVCPGKMPDNSVCGELLFAGIRKCYRCGHDFEMGSELDIRTNGGDSAVLSSQIEPEWHEVLSVSYAAHKKEDKKHATMKVTYSTIGGVFREWVCFDHPPGGYAHKKAYKWFMDQFPRFAMPESVEAAIKCPWRKPKAILTMPDGKFWRVIEYDFGSGDHDEDIEKQQEKNILENDYEIPF